MSQTKLRTLQERIEPFQEMTLRDDLCARCERPFVITRNPRIVKGQLVVVCGDCEVYPENIFTRKDNLP